MHNCNYALFIDLYILLIMLGSLYDYDMLYIFLLQLSLILTVFILLFIKDLYIYYHSIDISIRIFMHMCSCLIYNLKISPITILFYITYKFIIDRNND